VSVAAGRMSAPVAEQKVQAAAELLRALLVAGILK
jgi:hypothetical protein